MHSEQQISTVGIMSPGDMGHAIGRELRQNGFEVVACVHDRSERTRHLCRQADIREVEDLSQLVTQADVLLSILVPSQAESVAGELADVIRRCAATVHYVDCNAISPQTAERIAENIRAAGGMFTDGSIIGFPPGKASPPRLYLSGPQAELLRGIDVPGLEIKIIGAEIGHASGIKMCYAAMTKGTFALHFALAIVAQRLNLFEELLAELEFSQPTQLQQMNSFLPKLPAKASRWIGEMEQIAATFEEAGLTPRFHEAAAEIYQLISETRLGQETPETIDAHRTLEATITALSSGVPRAS